GVKGAARPLLADHEVVSLPSASTLAVLRRELAARAPAQEAVAVIADPVFDAHDPRVLGRGAPVPAPAPEPEKAKEKPSEPIGVAMLTRSAGDLGVQHFERLGGTREEATEIVRLAGKEHALLALDFDANLATARDGQLAKYRLVHFATHGLLDSQHPELSGLLLSTVDAHGRAQDGFLQLRDVYGLRLAADLVVLSACQTALGAQVWGEGVVGLVRGFMYAGAPRVVASSWRVPDRATAALMKRFYEGMLARKLTPAAALREAQLALWKSRKFSAPRDWAGFTLQGEWR
ncbi:MAG: CHAT domain-containing protein, partial [Deltaproteobacteria bacterium]|nr:CHAT domain-containing protein [Deltaproteobacteria bacterium]